MKAILTRGLIAAGKSTWTLEYIHEHPEYIRLNRDSFRIMLDGYSFSDSTEKLVTQMMRACIVEALEKGLNLIIDEQNLNEKRTQGMVLYLQDLGYEVEFKDFPITLGEAIERDKKRNNPIGENVIKKTWKRYEIQLKQMLEQHKPRYIPPAEGLLRCIIVDIDGTLSNSSQRKIFDFKECGSDKVIEPVGYVVRKLLQSCCLILLSGREEICRKETEKWLTDNYIPFDVLLMRKEGDYRADTIIKKELFEEHIHGKYNPLFIIDDRPAVLQMWVDMGLFVFNVNQDPMCKNNF